MEKHHSHKHHRQQEIQQIQGEPSIPIPAVAVHNFNVKYTTRLYKLFSYCGNITSIKRKKNQSTERGEALIMFDTLLSAKVATLLDGTRLHNDDMIRVEFVFAPDETGYKALRIKKRNALLRLIRRRRSPTSIIVRLLRKGYKIPEGTLEKAKYLDDSDLPGVEISREQDLEVHQTTKTAVSVKTGEASSSSEYSDSGDENREANAKEEESSQFESEQEFSERKTLADSRDYDQTTEANICSENALNVASARDHTGKSPDDKPAEIILISVPNATIVAEPTGALYAFSSDKFPDFSATTESNDRDSEIVQISSPTNTTVVAKPADEICTFRRPATFDILDFDGRVVTTVEDQPNGEIVDIATKEYLPTMVEQPSTGLFGKIGEAIDKTVHAVQNVAESAHDAMFPNIKSSLSPGEVPQDSVTKVRSAGGE